MKRTIQTRITAAMFMVACLAVPMHAHAIRDLPHRGAFTCDFELFVDPATPLDAQAGVIDHDRQLMSSADAAEGFKFDAFACLRRHHAHQPPSIGIVTPVTARESSLARYTTVPVMSSTL